MAIDFTSDHGARVLKQLETEQVIWLTTVAKSGTPQPNPVWFMYENDCLYIYTQESAVRLKNFVENDRVSLNFDSGADGEEVTIMTGRIGIDLNYPAVKDNPVYIEKYREGLKRIGSSPEKMSAEYPVVMCVRPEKLRGW